MFALACFFFRGLVGPVDLYQGVYQPALGQKLGCGLVSCGGCSIKCGSCLSGTVGQEFLVGGRESRQPLENLCVLC